MKTMVEMRPAQCLAPVALVFAAWCAAAAAVDLPNIGEASESYLSREEEQRLGDAFMRNIRRTLKISDDPEVEIYIQSLGERLISGGGIRGRDYTFFVVRDPAINAFAGPGGYIGINSGLILTTESEAELASVIAHEIAHVDQQHLARTFEAASRMSLPVTAAIIAAIILGKGDSQLGEAALAATAAGNVQSQINFTRTHEQEADRIGLQILAGAGFDPRSMPAFFERLQRAAGMYDNQQLEFLRTHPVTVSRIADTRNRAEQYPEQGAPDGAAYGIIRAKLRIDADNDPRKSVEYFRLRAAEQDAGADQRYGYALALYNNGSYDEARAEIERLAARDPERIAYQILLAQIESASGDAPRALGRFQRNLDLYPHNRPLTLLYAAALLRHQQPERARGLLAEYLRQRPATPAAYSLLAQAETEMRRRPEAHQALAEYYYLIGETATAIEQLNLALPLVEGSDANQTAKIKARLAQLKKEIPPEAAPRAPAPRRFAG